MHRKVPNAYYAFQVAWIPEKFAVKGKFLEIINSDGVWENGWEVMSDRCEGDWREFEDVNRLSQVYKKTRKASDIKKGNHAEKA